MKSEGDPIAVAQAMTTAMEGLANQLDALNSQVEAQRAYGRRNRRGIWVLGVSMAVDLALTVGVVISLAQSSNASDKASQVRTQQIVTCQASNEARANNKKLWEYLLALPPTSPRTEKQVRQIADFRAFVDKTFAPRDCTRI